MTYTGLGLMLPVQGKRVVLIQSTPLLLTSLEIGNHKPNSVLDIPKIPLDKSIPGEDEVKEIVTMLKSLPCSVIVFILLLLFCSTTFADTTFTDVTLETRLGDEGRGLGVACGDYDGDGDLDLYVACGGWGTFERYPDTLYRNDGNKFIEDGQLRHVGNGYDGVLVDYDNDGDLDFCLSTVEGVFLHRNLGKGAFSDNIASESGLRAGLRAYTSAFGDYDKDGYLDIYLGIAGSNLLYRNNGDGTFTDATSQAIVGDKRNSCSVHFFDYDNDGDLDIHVLNSEGRFSGVDDADLLYRSNGDGTFTEVGDKAGVRNEGRGRCAISGDYDNDGDLDLFVGGSHNALYRNNGDSTFTDVTEDADLTLLWGEVASFGDYDNDGYLDLYITGWGYPNSLYHNDGDGTFTDMAQKAGVAVEDVLSTGTIFFDCDNDGDLDLFVVTRGTSQMYRNNGTDNNWLRVKLIGTESNRNGNGARVKIESGNLKMMREISSGSFRVHPSLTEHFGMADNGEVDNIEVHWPSGKVDVLHNIPANQVIVMEEGVGLVEKRDFKNFTTKDGVPHNSVTAIDCAPDGTLWFGTKGGVSCYDGNQFKNFTNFTTTDGVPRNNVSTIYRDSDDTLWFGTWFGGVSHYDGKKFKNFTTKDGLPHNSVTAIDCAPDGTMWFGTWVGGVSRYDGNQFKTFTMKDGLPNNSITFIYSDSDDLLWFGTANGLSRYDGNQFKNFTIKDESVSNAICSLNRDTYGNFWIGTYAGVFRYDGRNFSPEGELKVAVLDIHQASDDVMWFATDIMGVAAYDGVAWSLLDKQDGLAGNNASSIEEDPNGYLWFGTDGGVTRYRRSETKPEVRIVSVLTDKEYTDLDAIPAVKTGNRVTIKYKSIDPKTVLEKQQYRYRIRELDDDWRSPTKETFFEASFDKSGTYIFEVQAIDRDLNYSEPVSVTLKVLPPLYLRAGFLIPTVGSSAILLVMLTILSIGYIKRRKQVQAYQKLAVQELQDARQVQMGLMPDTPPPIEGLELAGKCLSANTVSGDFFDYIQSVSPNEIALVVADVTGKAMKGAMNAVMVDGVLHMASEKTDQLSPGSLMSDLNNVLKARMERDMNVTMVISMIDAKSKELTLANAAHHAYPIIQRNGDIQILKTGGLPLGMRAGIQYAEEKFQLQSGDVIILMTDGIIEAKDSEDNDYSESGRLEKTITQFTYDMSAEAMVDAVINDAMDFSGDRTQRGARSNARLRLSDDMTVVVAKVL